MLNVGSGFPTAPIHTGAFFVLSKFPLGGLLVAIHLPTANALAVASFILNETADILRRIAEEESNLVGKLLLSANALG